MQTFTARFNSVCGDCGGRIVADVDEIIMVDGRAEHAQCDQDVDADEHVEFCNHCFMQLSVNGNCDCED